LMKKLAKNQRLKINCLKTTLRYAEPCKLVMPKPDSNRAGFYASLRLFYYDI
jgi:hypothetical protein